MTAIESAACRAFVATSVVATWSAGAFADVPNGIPFFSQLTYASSGAPVNGSVTAEARVYTAPAGGMAVHTEPLGSVPVSNGLFSVALDVAGDLDDDLASASQLYIEFTNG